MHQQVSKFGQLSIEFTEEIDQQGQDAICENLFDPSSYQLEDGDELLKRARQRLVFRRRNIGVDEDLCVKAFPLRNPISRLKHRKYALREFTNYREARKRGVPTPVPYAFVEKREWGLVSGAAVVIEDVSRLVDIQAIARLRQIPYSSAAHLAIPALCKLYESGANHVDARDENILVNPNGNEADDYCIIDWQYASFVAPRSTGLLEHLTAYFIRKAPDQDQPELLKEWTTAVHSAAATPVKFEDFIQSVRYLLEKKPSTRARLGLRM